jgi:enoyl-CoA hydratase/carnithine racemase
MANLSAVTYRAKDGVAWVTLNRPEKLNAFDDVMQKELRAIWRHVRQDDSVRVVILNAAGDRAFCTGIDRDYVMGEGKEANDALAKSTAPSPDPDHVEHPHVGYVGGPYSFDDPGEWLGPKSNDLWKPVIAAVHGIACGGAFYLLGEVDIIIASETATFFDPHVTANMIAAYEPLQMLPKMPFGEIVRMTLLGASERMSAARAHQIGLVSEVCKKTELLSQAEWIATEIAKSPPLAVQGSLRTLWAGRELSRAQALSMGWAFVAIGNTPENLAAGQQAFSAGERSKPRIR